MKILSNNTKSFGKVTNLTLLAIWIISIVGLIFSTIDFASRSRNYGINTITKELSIMNNDTLTISMIKNDDFLNSRHYSFNNKLKSVNDNGIEKLYSENIDFGIKKSQTGNTYLKIRKSAHGLNFDNANSNAEKIEYHFNLDGTNLNLNGYFLNSTLKRVSFFNQEIDVVLYLPEGQQIYIDNSTIKFLHYISSIQNIKGKNIIDHYYVMGKNKLNCLDCKNHTIIDVDTNAVDLKINKNGVKLNINTNNADTDNIKLNIDQKGVDLKINTDEGEILEVKIDKNGVTIK